MNAELLKSYLKDKGWSTAVNNIANHPDYVRNVVNKEKSKVYKWLSSNILFLNSRKTKVLTFNRTTKKCVLMFA